MPPRLLVCVRPVQGAGTDVPVRISALEGAMALAAACGGEITALAPEEPGGEDTLRACLALAADRAYLVRGTGWCGLDAVSIGLMMAGAIRALTAASGPFDVILCGDADPGQDGLGPAVAAGLGYPQVTGVSGAVLSGRSLLVRRAWDGEETGLRVKTPCVLSCLRPAGPAVYPKLARLMAANRAEIPVLPVQAEAYLQHLQSFSLRPRRRFVLTGDEAHAAAVVARALREEHLLSR